MSADKDPVASTVEAVVVFGALFLEGVVLRQAWGWFVVPLGAPAIGYWHALALATLVGLLVRQNGLERDTTKGVGEHLSAVLVSWFVLWLMHFGVKS